MSKPAAVEEGVVFPGEPGNRSSTTAGKNAFAAAAAPVDAALKDKILGERNWRYGYNKYVLEEVRLAAKSPKNAISMAKAGLAYLHENFQFIRNGKTLSVAEAMQHPEGKFFTAEIKGNRARSSKGLEVPYKGRTLRGEDLVKQIDRWVKYGTIEPGCGEAMKKVANKPESLDLSNEYFVLLGAGSAMGPFYLLMDMGANVIGLDLDREGIWNRLISYARESAGTLLVPTKSDPAGLSDAEIAKIAGANMTTATPEILDWLKNILPGKPLTVGNYAYLDGELHVRVSIAADAIMAGLCKARKDTTLAFLNTPTQAFVIPEEANKAARKNYAALTPVNLLLFLPRLLAGKKYLAKNALPPVTTESGSSAYVVDGLVVAQGPNYALAKCMQHWRVVAAVADGIRVSSNIAPSTATASVVHNKQFAWAYGGFHNFTPMEIFQQETSNAVMAALLVHDVRFPQPAVSNPWEVFMRAPFHGGIWRAGYKITSVGEVSAMLYFLNKAKLLLILLFVLIIAFFLFR